MPRLSSTGRCTRPTSVEGASATTPRGAGVVLDGRVFTFAALLASLTAIAFGLLPTRCAGRGGIVVDGRTSRDVEGVARIARAVAANPASEQAYGLAVSLVDIGTRIPDARELIDPLRHLVRSLRSTSLDTEKLNALEARVVRLGPGD